MNKNLECIRTIGIIPYASDEVLKSLSSAHWHCMLQEGIYNGKSTTLFIVFNMPEEGFLRLCKNKDISQCLFILFDNEEDDIHFRGASYVRHLVFPTDKNSRRKHKTAYLWLAEEKLEIQHSMDYQSHGLTVKGDRFHCVFSVTELKELDKKIQKNLESFGRKDSESRFSMANNGVGITPWYYRQNIYGTLS